MATNEDEIAATPHISIGDWVMDWSGTVLIWDKRLDLRATKHPVVLRYISQIRSRTGYVWVRAGRSESTGAPLKCAQPQSVDAVDPSDGARERDSMREKENS